MVRITFLLSNPIMTIRKFKIKKSFFFVCLSVLTITVGSLCVHRKETFDSNPDLRTLCAYYKRIQSTAGELFKKIHAERPREFILVLQNANNLLALLVLTKKN